MTVDHLKVVITAENADFNRKINAANQGLAGFQKQAVSSSASTNRMTSSMSSMGKSAALGGGRLAGAAVAAAAAITGLTAVIKKLTDVYSQMEASQMGLESILEAQGKSINAAKDWLQEYTKDGLIPLTEAYTAYKLLASAGYDDKQTQSVMQNLKDSAAFGRQGSLSMGEAVRSAAEGIKNENSVLVDNAGVTKNLSVIWKEYAESVGKGVQSLTAEEKRLATVQGLMRETAFQTGDAAKYASTLAGAQAALRAQTQQLSSALGSIFAPVLQRIIPYLTELAEWLTRIASKMGQVMAAIFGVDTQNNPTQQISEGAKKAETGLEGAKKKANELKKALMGFDELNILSKPAKETESPGPVAGGFSGSTIKTPDIDTSSIDTLTEKVKKYMQEIEDNIPEAAIHSFDSAIGRFKKSWGDLMKGFETGDGLISRVFGYFGTGVILKVTRLADAGAALIKMFDGAAHLDFAKFFDGWKNLNLTINSAPAERLANAVDHIFGTDTLSKLLKGKEVLMSLNLSDDAIPRVNLFAEGVSKITKQKVEPFLKEVDKLDTSIKTLSWKGELIKPAHVEAVKTQVGAIRKTILDELDADRDESLKKLSPLKNIMSGSEYNKILESSKSYYEKKKKSVQESETQINLIMQKASSEKRKLTSEEQQEINRLQEEMKETGIRHLSESEEESNLILQRLKDNAVNLSAQQASEIVKNSLKTKNQTIENANKQYTQIRMEAERMRETGEISEEQYNSIIAAAKKSKEDTIRNAEEQHQKILGEAQSQAGDLANTIDWSNGEVKSKYQVLKDEVVLKFKEMWEDIKAFFSIEKWKKIAKEATDALKNVFKDLKLEIKTPHFKWVENGIQATGTFRKTLEFLNLPTAMPRLDVSWYAQGGIFNKPSIIGVGEAGREAVVPLERNTGWIDSMAQKISERISPAAQTAPARPEQPLKITIQLRDTEMASWMINNINALQNKAGGLLLRI